MSDEVRMRNGKPCWTEEEDKLLRKLVLEGFSYGEIHRHFMPNRSRNSIISRAHRIGLVYAKPQIKRPPAAKPPPEVKEKRVHYNKRDRAFKGGDNKLLTEPDQCKWIDGDPKKNWQMCGKKTKHGSAYCAEHRKVCYEPRKPHKPKKVSHWPVGKSKRRAA